MKPLLTIERLKYLLTYDADTGLFYNRFGKKMGTLNKRHNYVYVGVDYKLYRAHRLAWFYTHGKWPEGDIDHINGVRDDNRLANLRDVTRSFNLLNRSGKKNNSTGHKGINKNKYGSYHTYISINNKRINLGFFSTLEEAIAARAAEVAKYDNK